MPRRKTPPPVPDPDQLPPGTPYVRYIRDSGGYAQEKSVPEQMAEITKDAEERRGWVCAGTFIDEAKSGTDPGREGLNALLEHLQQPNHAAVVSIWAYSRLAREEGIGFDILSHTRRAGVAIASVSDPVSHAHRGIMEPMYLWQAAQQSDKISQDTKRGMAAMISRGYAPGGFPPQGYKAEYEVVSIRRDGTPRKWPRWVQDPETQEATTLAWQMRLQSASYQAILAATKLFSSRSSLPTFFGNPAYCGFPSWHLRHFGLEVADCTDRSPVIPPYVSVAQWLQVQEMGHSHPRIAFAGWPLSGMMDCGYCGDACQVWAPGYTRHCDVCGADWPTATHTCPGCGADYLHRAGIHRYLCGRHQRRADRCPESRYVGGRTLERTLSAAILEHLTPTVLAEVVDEFNEALAALEQGVQGVRGQREKELVQVEAAVTHLLDLAEQGMGSEALFTRLREREQEAAKLRRELAMLPDPGPATRIDESAVQAIAELLRDRVPSFGRADLRQFFQGLGLHVKLYKDKAAARFEWPPLRLLLPIEHVRYTSLQDRVYPQPDSNRRPPA